MIDRPTPTEEQLARIFRSLADEHAASRAATSKSGSWRRLQIKWQDRVRQRSTAWLILPNWRVKVGALAVACALVLGFFAFSEPEELSFELRSATSGARTAQVDDGWIRTDAGQAALDFSDGSVVELAQNTLLNVTVFGAHSALTRVANGTITADIHHAEDTNWSFLAGPYEVRVVGTSFDLSWQDDRLSLNMHEGEVRVSGPDQQSWVLRTGQQLELTPVEPDTATAMVVPAPETQGTDESAQAPEVTTVPTPLPRSHKRASHSDDWSKLLATGKFDRIVQDARGRGLGDVLSSVPANDLAALAQAASYTGDAGLSKKTWRKLRARFPGSSSSTRGAFFLARLEEQQGQGADALRWLDTYLREAPGGVYAAEAHGRKLVLTRRMSGANSPKARTLARDYLERFPRGAYAETARATLAHR